MPERDSYKNDTDNNGQSRSEALMRGTFRDYMGTSVWYSSGEHLRIYEMKI